MQNLLAILVRYGSVIAFLILEGLCVVLVIKHNDDQNKIFTSSANYFSGVLNEQVTDLSRYFRLAEIADSLAQENALLLRMSEKSKFYTGFSKDTIIDTTHLQQYTYIPAGVINNSTQQHNNHLTLNKGDIHGIKPGMGVITGKGVIGIIRDVSKHFSHVMSILHRQIQISASLPSSKYFGTLIWKGNNPLFMDLQAIPKHVSIGKGDTVETSGYSAIFPAGIMIGTIDSFWLASGNNFYTIKVKLLEDLGNLTNAYVVDNLLVEEQMNIELNQDDGK